MKIGIQQPYIKNFKKSFHINNADSPLNLWRQWSKSIISGSKFITKFENRDELVDYFDSFQTDVDKKLQLIKILSNEIKGMGFAIACDFLKEIGYDYPKPDTHIVRVFTNLGYCSEKPTDVFKAVIRMANENNVSAYKVDKTFWLICSGFFYYEDIKVKSRYEQLMGLYKEIETGIVINSDDVSINQTAFLEDDNIDIMFKHQNSLNALDEIKECNDESDDGIIFINSSINVKLERVIENEKKYGFNILNLTINYDKDKNLNIIVEFSLEKTKYRLALKMNFYDDNNRILYVTEKKYKWFSGLDTINFKIQDSSIIENLSKIKVYINNYSD